MASKPLFRLLVSLSLLLLAACKGGDKSECEDRTDVLCEERYRYECDACGQVWGCGYFRDDGVGPVWGRSDWPCECISEDGTVRYYDTADTSTEFYCVEYP